MEFIGNLCCTLISVAQSYFDAGDEGEVYPVLSGCAAGLTYHGAQIVLGEAQPVGIVSQLVLLVALLIYQLEEAVEDGLFT